MRNHVPEDDPPRSGPDAVGGSVRTAAPLETAEEIGRSPSGTV
ncbi:hypothetical protein [Streptomyces sp. NBC_00273]|nr:hypothetical protein [Streptomyces sp. NBC_00273]